MWKKAIYDINIFTFQQTAAPSRHIPNATNGDARDHIDGTKQGAIEQRRKIEKGKRPEKQTAHH